MNFSHFRRDHRHSSLLENSGKVSSAQYGTFKEKNTAVLSTKYTDFSAIRKLSSSICKIHNNDAMI